MRRLVFLSTLLAALAFAAGASAKEAMVQVSSQPPGDIAAGTPWNTNITVMEHGNWPSATAPAVTLLNLRTGATTTILAKPTGRPGVFHASIRFPSAGDWSYTVTDRASDRVYEFNRPVTVAPAPSGDGGFPAWPFAAGAILLAVALSGGALRLVRRQRVALQA